MVPERHNDKHTVQNSGDGAFIEVMWPQPNEGKDANRATCGSIGISWGNGAVIQLLASHPPDGWKADVLASHSDGGVIDVLKAWWNVPRHSKPDWQSVMLMLFIFTLQHDGRGAQSWID